MVMAVGERQSALHGAHAYYVATDSESDTKRSALGERDGWRSAFGSTVRQVGEAILQSVVDCDGWEQPAEQHHTAKDPMDLYRGPRL